MPRFRQTRRSFPRLRPVFLLLLFARPAEAHPEIAAALAHLNPRIAAAPADAALLVQRGELYAKHADFLTAEANYRYAAELAPAHPRLARAFAALELATRRPAAARQRLDTALAANPRDAEALVLRARAHAALGDRPRAAQDLAGALQLLPAAPPELHLEYAGLLPPAAALAALDAGIDRLGPAVSLHLRALELEESLGRVDAALSRLDRLTTAAERPELWWRRRGELLARAGRDAESRAAYASALAAVAALPAWLREATATRQLTHDLAARLSAVPSSSP